MVSTVIRNNNGKAVPYARVHLRTKDGKYYTAYADINGRVNFRLPAQAGEKYNVTITGHNLIPSYFNFSTLPDNLIPEISDEDCSPDEPTVSDNVCFEVNTYDLQSGLESVFLLQSEDNEDFVDLEETTVSLGEFDTFEQASEALKDLETQYTGWKS